MSGHFGLGSFVALGCALILAAETQSRVGPAIGGGGGTSVLAGNTRMPVVRGLARDKGEVADRGVRLRMALHFSKTAAQAADLQALLEALQNPASPQYHHFLTPEEYADRFGVSNSDLIQVTDWLSGEGFSNIQSARSRTWVSFTGSIQQAEEVFQTAIHTYELSGESYFANSSDPKLPKGIAGLAQSLRGLTNLGPKPNVKLKPNFTSYISGNHFLAPDDWQTIYNVKPLYGLGLDGTGVTIAIVGESDVQLSDMAAFRSAANLNTAVAPTVLLPPGYVDPGILSGAETEADLDLEWANAIAENAKVVYVVVGPNDGGVDEAMLYAIDNNVASILSTSWGACDGYLNSGYINAMDGIFQQANAQGMTIVAAGGDGGAAECDRFNAVAVDGLHVPYPASSPYVTAVGGTSFTEGAGNYWATTNNSSQGSAMSYIPETVWNDANSAAGGGGASAFEEKPAWQTGIGVPNDGMRDVPDVAFAASGAHDGILICGDGWCTNGFRNSTDYLDVVGGTSAGAPSFAGLLALIEQKTGGRLGNINPHLYALGGNTSGIFHDITTGNNMVVCEIGTPDCTTGTMGFSAGVGYDQASGWGTVDASAMAAAWLMQVQSINFTAIGGTQTVGTNLTLSATASSGLAVSYSASPASVCSLTGTSLVLVNVGTCTVVASQGGTSTYLAAVPVTQTFSVYVAQTLSFGAIANQSAGTTLTLTASASSGLPVQYTSSPTTICTVSGNTAQLLAPGHCTITAAQSGAGTYEPVSATQTFGVIAVVTPTVALRYVPVTPCRVADTRLASGPFGGPEMAAGATRDFVIPNSTCQIPTNALAYSLNVTVVPDHALSYLSIWPTGSAQPYVSTLNSDGRIKASAAIVGAGSDSGVSVYVTDPTQVILDINGYFVANSSSALAFYPLTPCRVADTRLSTGALGGPYLGGGVARSFPVLSSACGIPANAQAYSLNFTAVPHVPLAYLATWPSGQAQPLVSTLNAWTGAVTANAGIVPAGSGGAIDVYASNDADVVIDINGYFAPPNSGGLSLYLMTACRALDTREVMTAGFTGSSTANITGSVCAPPTTAQAYLLNATVVPNGALGYLTLWPDGATQPFVSTLNASDGGITSNLAIVSSTNGKVDAYAAGKTQLILDISGYFLP